MTKVDQRMFDAVKIMLDNGATIMEAAKYMKLGKNTVLWIKQAETFSEYKNILAAVYAKSNQKKKEQSEPKKEQPKEQPKPPVQVVEHRQNVTIQATHYMMTELQTMNEHLKLISSKLAFIVDELCGTRRDTHESAHENC